MNRRALGPIVALALVALAIGIFIALKPETPAPSGNPDAGAAAPKPLRAASILMLEGSFKSYGENVRAGINAAVEDIAAGHGDRLEVTIKSFDGDPTKALDLVTEAAQRENHRFIIEVFGTAAALNVCDFVNQNGVVTISGVDTGHALTEKMGKYFFRIIPSDGEAVQALVAWATELGAKRAGVVAVTTDWGKGMAEMLEYYSKRSGLPLVRENFDKSNVVFGPTVTSFKSANIDTVFLAVNPDQAGNFTRALKAAGFAPKVLGTDNLTAGEFTTTAADAAVGVRYLLPTSPAKSEQRNTLLRGLRARLGLAADQDPHPFSLYGYDATWLTYRAMKASDSDPQRAVQYLESYSGTGVTGPIRFTKAHDIVLAGPFQRMVFKEINGKIQSAGDN